MKTKLTETTVFAADCPFWFESLVDKIFLLTCEEAKMAIVCRGSADAKKNRGHSFSLDFYCSNVPLVTCARVLDQNVQRNGNVPQYKQEGSWKVSDIP